jgi:Tol biopolymer transport system component
MPLSIGTQLGSHEITALLGKGGMGEVYRARDLKLKREVAIKILPEEFSRDSDRVSRFQREAEVLASLNHPNIAAIHDVEETNGTRYLVLELVGGETLADRLMRGPIPLDEAVQVARQIVDALEAAHERGIVHRDLKPGNIKIGSDGKVKVLDFGLAKVATPSAAAEAFSNSPTLMSGSLGGVILGTAPYMSPEQARGKTVDARTDVWAFGCVLYEMLTGKRAFAGETTTDTLAKVLEAQPHWEALPATVPGTIRMLLEAALSKDPKDRLQHIDDARVFLNRSSMLMEKPSITVVDDGGRRRAWFVAAALALVLIAALVPAALYFMRAPAELPVMRFEMPAPGMIPTLRGGGLAISPDGQRIAYVAENGGKRAIWIRALGSLTAQQLPGTENANAPFWSPDSRRLAFYADGKLKKTDVSGGGVQILADAPIFAAPGAWNSDGVILFGSSVPSAGIVRISDAGGDAVPVTAAPDAAANPIQLAPVFLPDGHHFLFHAADGQNGTVYLGSLDSKSVTKLMGLPNFNPTSTNSAVTYAQGYLLFSRDRSLFAQPFDAGHGKLVGDPVPIAENVGAELSVSSKGVLIYRSAPFQSGQNQSASSHLTWVDRKGKPAGELSVPAIAGNILLSPDGRVAMDNLGGTLSQADVWVIDARGVPNKLTADNPNLDGAPVWSPDGQQIAFMSGRAKGLISSGIYQRSSNGVGAAELLLSTSAGIIDVPRDWFRGGIVFERAKQDAVLSSSDLWWLSMPEKKPSLYLHNGFVITQAQVSPDGRYIAYTTNQAGSYQIVVQTFPDPAAGKWPITAQGGAEPLWKPDGRELYYLGTEGKIMAVDVKTDPAFQAGQPVELFQTALTPEFRPISYRYAVSADGQRFLIALPPTAPVAGPGNSDPITAVVNWTSVITRK